MALPTWVPDDETKPAPMPLLVVQSFVNTWEADSGTDLLTDPVAGPQWLEQTGLADEPVDLVEVREIRESIRALLVQNSDGQAADLVHLGPLRDLANRVRLRVAVLDDGSVEVLPDEDIAAPLVPLLLIIRDAQRDGSWERLKACRNPDCRWAYYDRSHAGRGAWCDMAVCGNRMKNRNLRARRSGDQTRSAP